MKTYKIIALLALIALTPFSGQVFGQQHYTNPIIHADYSDPDVCRVGKDFYMTSSSFNCMPGLQILHSTDLVHWEIIGAALEDYPVEGWNDKVQHGNGIWAPAIRHHNGEFYIYCGDPDRGIFMVKTSDPRGHWDAPVWVVKAKGYIDPCPLWDDDGNAYLSHGCAGSRAGIKSVLFVAPMSPDGTELLASTRIVYDGHKTQPTIEGTKFYKRNGWYYIFAPAGGVSTGWQTVLRSRNPYGPYEEKVVMAQGNSPVNGPHQGAWIDTPAGEDWFIHFQDKGPYGRITHLQPMTWVEDWPVIGIDEDGDGVGEPVMKYR
ncbi:MAG: glycoside hydrolase 43 family protein, partial [Bacteroidales bacterium]|nr:glycoside hydrolase 43 family protein [Bacteroidales bacterium]